MRLMSRYGLYVLWVLLVLCFSLPAHSQVIAPKTDSTKSTKPRQIRPGIELPDSLYISADSIKGDVDTIVRYTAKDSVIFDVPNKRMILVNDAVVQFQNRELDAHTIVMDFQQNTLTAYSEDADSVITHSLGLRRKIIRDTSRARLRGSPVLTEGSTKYEGEVIVYNFKTKHGTVQMGTTELEGGFYYGEKIKQVAPKTLFVENGRYTTCDAPIPHYYFESPRMKVIMQDEVFAEPVYLYIADVPIFALPFGVFPNHGGGRHSGIIAPSYQTQGDRGYGLTHAGYFWVINDYLDLAAQTDIYTKGGWSVDSRFRWMKQYLLNSPADIHVAYGMERTNSVDPYTKQWLLQGSLPNLVLGYESNLSANLSFQSSDYSKLNAHNQRDYLTQQVNSNASYSTGWEDLGLSLGIGYNRSQNLLQNTYDEESPSLNFSKSTFFPFASRDGADVNPTLASLGIGYNLSASRHVTKQRNSNATEIPEDTSTYFNTEQYSILHNPSINISPKLGYFSINPSFSYQEAWLFKAHLRTYRRVINFDSITGRSDTSVAYDQSTVDTFQRLKTYNAGIGISTTLYGIANIGALGIQAVRHTVIPSIRFNYQPDLSDQNYADYTDPITGQPLRYNVYDGEPNGSLVGAGRSASMSFALGNDFEAKVERQVTKDSVALDHVKLLHLDANTSYNLVDKLLGGFSLNGSSSIGTYLSMNARAQFSFYPRNYFGGDSTQATLISLGAGLLRPQNISFGLSGSLSAPTTIEGDNYDSIRRQFNITTPEDERAMFFGGFYPGPFVDIPFRPKWNVSYSLSYDQTYTLNGIDKNFGANATISLPLTVNWLFSTSATYDLKNQKLLIPELRVTRDLHCWVMNFSYWPPGSGFSGFNLEIRIKAPQLQDVKLTRTESTYGQF
jgi:hypothetical protein